MVMSMMDGRIKATYAIKTTSNNITFSKERKKIYLLTRK